MMSFFPRNHEKLILPGMVLSSVLHLLALAFIPGEAVDFLLRTSESHITAPARMEIITVSRETTPIYREKGTLEDNSYRFDISPAPPLPEPVLRLTAVDSAVIRLEPMAIEEEQYTASRDDFPPLVVSSSFSFAQGWQADSAESIESYIADIYSLISKAGRYPEVSRRMGHVGDIEVGFAIGRDGALSGEANLVSPCPYSLLNRAACRSVIRSAPFPPLPGCIRRDSLSLRVKILYELEP
ncbi:MAG: TonB family protein [Gemmatimonadota bacterium]|nr:TonB family protein [Gemmatimonadota bacterium]